MNILASERSERDTYRGNTIENRDVCLFIYMDVRMSFCTLTLRIFVRSAFDPIPNFTKQNPLV